MSKLGVGVYRESTWPPSTFASACSVTSQVFLLIMHDFCLTIPYGMVVMAGGVIGFLAAGSRASLVAGVSD